MNAPVALQHLLQPAPAPTPAPVAAAPAQRWEWHGRYGCIVIEVVDGRVYVNGSLVEPATP